MVGSGLVERKGRWMEGVVDIAHQNPSFVVVKSMKTMIEFDSLVPMVVETFENLVGIG